MDDPDQTSVGDVLRKRLRRREIPGGVRFITFSCQRRLPLLGNPRIADIVVEALEGARLAHGFALFAFVVMPEHVHRLVRPLEGPDPVPLDRSLLWMKLSVARRVLPRWRKLRAPILDRVRDRTNTPRFWQKGGGFDRNVRDEAELTKTIRYIHRNPVERGLVERPEVWRWSSVRWWMGLREGELACDRLPGAGWDAWKGFA